MSDFLLRQLRAIRPRPRPRLTLVCACPAASYGAAAKLFTAIVGREPTELDDPVGYLADLVAPLASRLANAPPAADEQRMWEASCAAGR